MNSDHVVLVVPCFNEAARWRHDYWSEILEDPRINVLFVDDGSSDGTVDCVVRECKHPSAEFMSLPRNMGKAEAVRSGLLQALRQQPGIVSFLDADGAFPAGEVRRLCALASDLLLAEQPDYDSVWSSRVMLAGRQISRDTARHYLGRAIATLVAPMHRYEVYDTQSGFKLFTTSEAFTACLEMPFLTRWFPDVELLQRWTQGVGTQMRIWEEPVIGWKEVAGSKLDRSQYLQLLKDLRHVYGGRVSRRADL